jgi:fumarate hydratase, class II
VGTGLNAPPGFAVKVIERLAGSTGRPFRQADNLFEALACRDAQAELMGALDVIAGSLLKISGDLRLLSSGPRAGLGEITLPALQPGSSIMPGKVNPVIPEVVAQVAIYVKGQAHAVSQAAWMAPLELNIMMPLIAYETLDALSMLRNTCAVFTVKCVQGITADASRCSQWVEQSLALITPLAAQIGYDRAAAIASRALREKKTVREVLLDDGELTPEQIERLLSPPP